MKTSSRQGRFKKKLVDKQTLESEAKTIAESFEPILSLYKSGEIKDFELTALYIINYLAIRYPFHWAGAKRNQPICEHQMHRKISEYPLQLKPSIQSRINNLSLGDVWANFAYKATPLTVHRAILKWSLGEYHLDLLFHIPTSEQVLNSQKFGRRCVTVLYESERISNYILGQRDALSFCYHDLIHADHFYHHNECYLGQLGLYGFLDKHLNDFDELKVLPSFHAELEYLISDMNAYAVHSLKCLKAAITHYGSDDHFSNWANQFPVKEMLLKLNTDQYDPHLYDHHLLNWLNDYRQI